MRVKFQIAAAAYEIIVPDTLCDFGVVFDRESFSAKHIEDSMKRSEMRIFEPPGISALPEVIRTLLLVLTIKGATICCAQGQNIYVEKRGADPPRCVQT